MINVRELRLGNMIRYVRELQQMEVYPHAGVAMIGGKHVPPHKPVDMVVKIHGRYFGLANTISGYDGCKQEDYEGIPIKAVHLLNMDFKYLRTDIFSCDSKEIFWIYSNKELEGFRVIFNDEWYGFEGSTKENPIKSIYADYEGNYIKQIKYIHELQNLYYLLTEKELIFENWKSTWEQFFGYGFFPPKK